MLRVRVRVRGSQAADAAALPPGSPLLRPRFLKRPETAAAGESSHSDASFHDRKVLVDATAPFWTGGCNEGASSMLNEILFFMNT